MPKGNPTIEQRLSEAHVAITNVRASSFDVSSPTEFIANSDEIYQRESISNMTSQAVSDIPNFCFIVFASAGAMS